jgi:hypothetical protein
LSFLSLSEPFLLKDNADLITTSVSELPEIKLHFHTMTTNKPHPLAVTKYGSGADIYLYKHLSLNGAEMQILDNLIALHTYCDLFIWNWHTGELLVYVQCDPRSMTEFDFLSRRYFMITTSSQAEIHLYDLYETIKLRHPSPPTTAKPKVVLSFPPRFVDAEDKRIWTHTSPFITRRDNEGVKPYPGSGSDVLPFQPADESRIHVFTIELVPDNRQEPVYFFVTIKNSWLVKCVEEHGQSSQTFLQWRDWGKEYSHWQRTERIHAWLR